MKRFHLFALGTFATFAAGCASAAIPAQKLTDSKASVRAAEAVGAESHPRAALHLKMARDQIQQAERLIEEDENERARLVLERADADAELAIAMAEEEKAKAEARTAKQKVDELRQKASQ